MDNRFPKNPSPSKNRLQEFNNFPTFGAMQFSSNGPPRKFEKTQYPVSNPNYGIPNGMPNFPLNQSPEKRMSQTNGNIYQNMGSSPVTNFNTKVEKSQNKSTYDPYLPMDNYSSKPMPTKMQNYDSGKKDTFTKPANKQSVNTNSNQKDEKEVSWTNYISLQFKLQELQTKYDKQEQTIKNKDQRISQLEKMMTQNRQTQMKQYQNLQMKYKKQSQNERVALQSNLEQTVKTKDQKIAWLERLLQESREKERKTIQACQIKFKKQYQDQSMGLQQSLQKKNQQIDQLVQKLMDESKMSIVDEMKKHIQQQLKQTANFETELTAQKQINEQLVSKIKTLEAQQALYQSERQGRDEIMNKMVQDLKVVVDKVLKRNLNNPENEIFLHISKSQTSQVQEIKKNYDGLHAQYLKLREMLAESTNKIQNMTNVQKVQTMKLRLKANAQLAELGAKLTVKQSENTSLKIKLAALERKFKSAIDEQKVKFENIAHLMSRKQNTLDEIEEIKAAIVKAKNTEHCQNCARHQLQLQSQKQKLLLLCN